LTTAHNALMSRVFLSHSSRDSRAAVAVKAWLVEQEPGLTEEIFLDLDPHTGIRPGERWKQALQQANTRCEAVICLLSQYWEASHECKTEYRYAETLNKTIVCARLEPLPDPGITSVWQRCDLFVGDGPTVAIAVDGGEPVVLSVHGLRRLLEGIVTLVSVGDLEGSVGVRTATASYRGHRYPVEIIGHCVWLYFRFSLSFREVEELMLARGVVVSYETIRRWCAKFGQAYANQLRRRRPHPGDKWHLDEVFIRINGKIHYLWRAVDQHGNVLDILVQPRRDAKAAKKFFRRLLKGLRYVPRVLVTDKLASYGAAHRVVMPSVAHRRSRYLNNRAENSHQPTRHRERAMKRFTSAGHAQRFLSAFSGISPHFRVRRHLLSAADYRRVMADRFAVWGEVTALDAAA